VGAHRDGWPTRIADCRTGCCLDHMGSPSWRGRSNRRLLPRRQAHFVVAATLATTRCGSLGQLSLYAGCATVPVSPRSTSARAHPAGRPISPPYNIARPCSRRSATWSFKGSSSRPPAKLANAAGGRRSVHLPNSHPDAAPAARSTLRDSDFSPTGRADLAADRRLPRPDARGRSRRPNQRDRGRYSGPCAASGCVPMKCFSVA